MLDTTLKSTNMSKSKNLKETLKNFIILGRPRFLLYSTLIQLMAAAVAYEEFQLFSIPVFLFGLLVILVAHLSTHYLNEYFDLGADIANATFTTWTGGSRILTNQKIKPTSSLKLGQYLTALTWALLFSSYYFYPTLLGAEPKSVLLVVLLVTSISWAYSAPPIRLIRLGLGETAVSVVLCLLVPAFVSILQTGSMATTLYYLAIPFSCIQFARMMVMNIPDAVSDARTGKRTFIVRVGPKVTNILHAVLQASAYISILLLWNFGKLNAFMAVPLLATFPIAILQSVRILRGDAVDKTRFQRLANTSLSHIFLTTAIVLFAALAQIFMAV